MEAQGKASSFERSTHWQSIRSVMPPCPGIESPKSFTLNARLKPDAKNPPKGATSEAKTAMIMACSWKVAYGMRVMSKVVCEHPR